MHNSSSVGSSDPTMCAPLTISSFNARAIRSALDRARLRQANRLFAQAAAGAAAPDRQQLMILSADDIRASRVFRGGLAGSETPASQAR